MSTAPLEVRREELQHRVDVSRHDLERAVRDLRRATTRRIAPRQVARRHPWALLAGAALLGLWAGARVGAPPELPTPRTRRTNR
jgi:hypothetical protein